MGILLENSVHTHGYAHEHTIWMDVMFQRTSVDFFCKLAQLVHIAKTYMCLYNYSEKVYTFSLSSSYQLHQGSCQFKSKLHRYVQPSAKRVMQHWQFNTKHVDVTVTADALVCWLAFVAIFETFCNSLIVHVWPCKNYYHVVKWL